MTPSDPIDIVYLWVNGNDPAWRARRHTAIRKLSRGTRDALAVYGNVEGRFRDNDELRYSLRALERFFPLHGRIYLVTDGQTPTWLQDSPLVTVVDHRELIPASALPTFDSGHIESYIHRIAGLSERFFYFNDDVFFGAPVDERDWFWQDKPRMVKGTPNSGCNSGIYLAWSDDAPVPDGPMLPSATSLENGCRLSAHWLARHPPPVLLDYRHTPRTFAHSPRPLLKSLLFKLEFEAPELFAQVRSTVFRTWDKPTIVSDFVLRWALAHGVARVRDYSHQYVSTGELSTVDFKTGTQLTGLMAAFGALDFFCINDTTDDAHAHDHRLTRVRKALGHMLSRPSSFERLSG